MAGLNVIGLTVEVSVGVSGDDLLGVSVGIVDSLS